jgi:hypothetical protein
VTATLTGPPTGQVKVVARSADGTERIVVWATVDADGKVSGTHQLAKGTTTFTASYPGDWDAFWPPATATASMTR